MAPNGSPQGRGVATPRSLKIGGDLRGGTDFLIAGTGGGFNVPIRKAAWRNRQNDLWRRVD